jgi:hypothetical protein
MWFFSELRERSPKSFCDFHLDQLKLLHTGMARSIRILSSTDVDKILAQLDTDELINVHTARLFRTLAVANVNANAGRSKSDGSNTNQTPHPQEVFVDSPHRLAIQAGTSSILEDTEDNSNGGRTRTRTRTRGGLYTTLVMPSSVVSYGTTVKLVSVPTPAPAPANRPSHCHPHKGIPATTVVMDERTGTVKAVVNARALNIRTALGEFALCYVILYYICALLEIRPDHPSALLWAVFADSGVPV